MEAVSEHEALDPLALAVGGNGQSAQGEVKRAGVKVATHDGHPWLAPSDTFQGGTELVHPLAMVYPHVQVDVAHRHGPFGTLDVGNQGDPLSGSPRHAQKGQFHPFDIRQRKPAQDSDPVRSSTCWSGGTIGAIVPQDGGHAFGPTLAFGGMRFNLLQQDDVARRQVGVRGDRLGQGGGPLPEMDIPSRNAHRAMGRPPLYAASPALASVLVFSNEFWYPDGNTNPNPMHPLVTKKSTTLLIAVVSTLLGIFVAYAGLSGDTFATSLLTGQSFEDRWSWSSSGSPGTSCVLDQVRISGPASITAGGEQAWFWAQPITNIGTLPCTIYGVTATFSVTGAVTSSQSFSLGDLAEGKSFAPIRYPVSIPASAPAGTVTVSVSIAGYGSNRVTSTMTANVVPAQTQCSASVAIRSVGTGGKIVLGGQNPITVDYSNFPAPVPGSTSLVVSAGNTSFDMGLTASTSSSTTTFTVPCTHTGQTIAIRATGRSGTCSATSATIELPVDRSGCATATPSPTATPTPTVAPTPTPTPTPYVPPVTTGQSCSVSADCNPGITNPAQWRYSCNYIAGINEWQCRLNSNPPPGGNPTPPSTQCLTAGQSCSTGNPNACCSRSCNSWTRRCN